MGNGCSTCTSLDEDKTQFMFQPVIRLEAPQQRSESRVIQQHSMYLNRQQISSQRKKKGDKPIETPIFSSA